MIVDRFVREEDHSGCHATPPPAPPRSGEGSESLLPSPLREGAGGGVLLQVPPLTGGITAISLVSVTTTSSPAKSESTAIAQRASNSRSAGLVSPRPRR